MNLRLTKAQTRTLKNEGRVVIQQSGVYDVIIKQEKVGDDAHKKTTRTVTIKPKEPITVTLASLTNESEFFIEAHFENDLNIEAETNVKIEVNDHMDTFEDYKDCKNKFKKLAADAERLTELGKPNQFYRMVLYEKTPKGKLIKRAEWSISEGIKWYD